MVPKTPFNIRLDELLAIALESQELFESQGWTSEPRYPKDVEITLMTGPRTEKLFIDTL